MIHVVLLAAVHHPEELFWVERCRIVNIRNNLFLFLGRFWNSNDTPVEFVATVRQVRNYLSRTGYLFYAASLHSAVQFYFVWKRSAPIIYRSHACTRGAAA